MKKIVVTGNIGSGKSTVMDYLSKKGYATLDADSEVKKLYYTPEIKSYITSFCEVCYSEGIPQFSKISPYIFKENKYREELLKRLYALLNENIALFFETCEKKEEATHCFIEAAVFLEQYEHLSWGELIDEVWIIEATHHLKIERAMFRDHSTKEAVEQRLLRQYTGNDRKHSNVLRHLPHIIIQNDETRSSLYDAVEDAL